MCTEDPETKLPMHSLCPTTEWEREWHRITTPNIASVQGLFLFPFGATPPLIEEPEAVVEAESIAAFQRDPMDLVVTIGGEPLARAQFFESCAARESFERPWEGACLREGTHFQLESPRIVGRLQDSGARRIVYGNYGGRNHHKHNPHKLHDVPFLKKIADGVLDTATKNVVVGGSCGAAPFSTWQKFRAMTTPHSTCIAMPPLHCARRQIDC